MSAKQSNQTLSLCLARHGQSQWNLWRRESFTKFRLREWLTYDPGFRDPSLTTNGQLDALRVKNAVEAVVNKQGKPFDLICCSPLRRALETAGVVATDKTVDSLKYSQNQRVTVYPFLREWRDTMSDIGTPLTILRAEYCDFDFVDAEGSITASSSDARSKFEDAWWYGPDEGTKVRVWPRLVPVESARSVDQRAKRLLELLATKSDCDRICVVGHSNYFKLLTGLPKLQNGDTVCFDVDRPSLKAALAQKNNIPAAKLFRQCATIKG